MAKNTRRLATLAVEVEPKTNSIKTVQAYIFKPKKIEQDKYIGAAFAAFALCVLLAILFHVAFLAPAVIAGGAGVLMNIHGYGSRARQLDCKNSYSGELPKSQASFLKLYEVQNEVRRYMAKNIVPDLFVERFNNLTLRANQVYAYLTTPGLEPREEELMLDKAHGLAKGVQHAFDELYADLIQQAELDPHVSKYGALVESMREFELRASDQEEQDYRELRLTYKHEIERVATDPRDYV